MKTSLCLSACFAILFCGVVFGQKPADPARGTETMLRIVSSPELESLSSNWIIAFSKSHPEMKIELSVLQSGMVSAPDSGELLGIRYQSPGSSATDPGAFRMVVGRDVVVPVYSERNPNASLIRESGLSAAEFKKLLDTVSQPAWSALVGSPASGLAHFYSANDARLNEAISRFTSGKAGKAGIHVPDGAEVVYAIQNDPLGVGFCRLSDLTGPDGITFAKGVLPVPVDKNSNGQIDPVERIYTDPMTMARAVWIGKYPKSLSAGILVCANSPEISSNGKEFVSWVLRDGQSVLNQNGYSDLALTEKNMHLAKLSEASPEPLLAESPRSGFLTFLLILGAILIGGWVLNILLRRFVLPETSREDQPHGTPPRFSLKSLNIPGGLFYDTTHTWAFMDEKGTVRVGIDDFLTHVTGPLTRVELRQPGEKIRKGEPLCTLVQKGKQLTVYSPVSGTILGRNEDVMNDSTYLDSSPFSEGWMYRIEPTNWLREILFLQMADKYTLWLQTEFRRVRDFVAGYQPAGQLQTMPLVLQEGGELADHPLESMGPEAWEEFQRHFVDTAR